MKVFSTFVAGNLFHVGQLILIKWQGFWWPGFIKTIGKHLKVEYAESSAFT